MNWETLLKRNIAVTTGKTKTVDLPIVEDEDENCERRFWNLWENLKNHMSLFKERKPYWLNNNNLHKNITDKDYCGIIEYLKELKNQNWINDNYEWDVGDTLNIWFIRHRYTTKKNGESKIRYAIEIYQYGGSPHPLFQINVYDKEKFLEVIRRFA